MSQLSHAQFPLRQHPDLLVDHRRARSAAVAEPRRANNQSRDRPRWQASFRNGGRNQIGTVADFKSVPRVATHGIDACEDYNTSGIVLDTDFMARCAKPLRKPYDLRPGEADVRQVDRLNVNHNAVLENLEFVGRHRPICVAEAWKKQGTEAATKPFHMPVCVLYLIIVAVLCSANTRRRAGRHLVDLSEKQGKASWPALPSLSARIVQGTAWRLGVRAPKR